MGSGTSSVIDLLYDAGIFKERYAIHPIPSVREDLLNVQIRRAFIVLVPFNKITEKIQTVDLFVGVHLPCVLSAASLVHAALFVPTNGCDSEGVLIEYGAYDRRRDGDYEGQVHFFEGRDGLRFVKINMLEIRRKFNVLYFQLIACNVKFPMPIGNLLNAVRYKIWNQDSYNPFGKNCQKFVCESVKVLGLYRPGLRNHTSDKLDIPFVILKELENNEDDWGNKVWRGVNKIPLIGSTVGAFADVFIQR